MPDTIIYDYFYGDEAEQFNYFRIPRLLITNPRFKFLSAEAKLLYGMMLDRMSLSVKNKWYDEDKRVYIYFTVEEICENLNCCRDKSMKLLSELDTSRGVGLVERVKQGQGKPTKLYVKRFTTREIPPQPEQPSLPVPPQEVVFSDVQTSDFSTSRGRDDRLAEVEEADGNYNNKNQTDLSHTDPSIYPPTPGAGPLEIDRYDAREQIKRQIDYDSLELTRPYDDVESMLELLVDVMTSTAATICIGGQTFPMAAVKERFSRLDREHIAYVIDSLRQTTTKINNIRAYLLTALYNAPVTIGPYYSAAVRHDFP